MTIWAIVPVKPFDEAKSRLAEVLGPAERRALARRLLLRTLEVLAAAPAIGERLVVSRDPEALGLAVSSGAQALAEPGYGAPDLNAALRGATQSAIQAGARAVLVLPVDLPLLTSQDLAGLLAAGADGPGIVVAPDRRESGTNALLVRPPGLVAYAFGVDSFAAHCAQAGAAGVPLQVVRSPTLAFDLDLPEDWRQIQEYTGAHNPLDPSWRPP